MVQPTAKTIPTRHAILPIKFAWAAGSTSPVNIDWMPGDILLLRNSHASAAKTFTVVSHPKDSRVDLTITAFSLAAGEYAVCPRFGDQDLSSIALTCETTDIMAARLSTKVQPS